MEVPNAETQINQDDRKYSRASKQLGDFGEGLVTYALIRKRYEVAVVDHVGADLIAQRGEMRIAVSVKTRMFREDSKESRGMVIEKDHIEKLKVFADRFKLEPVFANVVSIIDDNKIRLFMLRVADIEKHLLKVKHGYSLQFSNKQLEQTIALPYVDYSEWCNEKIGSNL